MNYSTFCNVLTLSLSACAESGTRLTRETIRKNNGVRRDALIMKPAGNSYAPVVYLEPLFESYRSGSSIEAICDAVLGCLRNPLPLPPKVLARVHDLDAVRDRITFRLISREKNRERLEDVPWIPFQNMAIIFYLSLDSETTFSTAAMIHSHLTLLWNCSADQLLKMAKVNTPRIYPAVTIRMEDMLFGPAANQVPDGLSPSLHILTNERGLFGAACMLYEDAVADFADRMESDVIILPSSIHEVLLLPDRKSFDYDSLCEIVKSVNSTAVSREDFLSDSLYLYSRSRKTVTEWPPASCHRP